MEVKVTRTSGSNDELYHYGVKGMKWGVRKKEYITVGEAKRNARGAARKAYSESMTSDKARSRQMRSEGKGWVTNAQAKRNARNAARTAYGESMNKDVEFNKQKRAEKAVRTKQKVEDYKKTWDEAEKAQDTADAKWSEVSEKYKSLGRNRLQRMINSTKNSDAAKDYRKTWDDAEALEEIAETKWSEVSTKYKSLGRNRVERMMNATRY